MTLRDFDTYYRLYASDILAIARYIVRDDDDLVADLYQIGLIALWQFDVSKVLKNERACIRQHCRNRMVDFVRSQRLDLYESLNSLLARGDQLVRARDGTPSVLSGMTAQWRGDDTFHADTEPADDN